MRVLLNCAVSRDGFLAGPDRAPVRLSDEADLRRVHALRAASDAILVGVGTVLADDPSLRVKPEYHPAPAGLPIRDPLRVVLDTRLRTPSDARVADGAVSTLVYHACPPHPVGQATPVRVPAAPGGVELRAVLADLERRGVRTLMVEGGADVLATFVRQGLWHEATVYVAPVRLGGGPRLPSMPEDLLVSEAAAGEGTLRTYRNPTRA